MSRIDAVWDWGDRTVPSDGPCGRCGIDASQAPPNDLGPSILALLPRWAAVLMRPGVGSAAGPLAQSALEHAVQVRDLFGAMATRLGRLLHEDDPLLRDWDWATHCCLAVGQNGGSDPVQIAVELEDAGRAVAARLAALAPSYVARHGAGSAETPAAVLSLGRHLVHDVIHHLHAVNAWQTPDEWLAHEASYPQNLSTGL